MKLNQSIVSSFFDKNEILKLFIKFKIISLYNTTEYEFNSKYKSSMWIRVAKRK